MGYKNGKEIFPRELLNELQKYVQGELIYIPRNSDRIGWGELSGTKLYMCNRNREIYKKYKDGFTVDELMELYHLSCDSIKKIVYKTRQMEQKEV